MSSIVMCRDDDIIITRQSVMVYGAYEFIFMFSAADDGKQLAISTVDEYEVIEQMLADKVTPSDIYSFLAL